MKNSHNDSADKRIAKSIRSYITSGKWKAGSRIPLRLELESSLGASAATVQKALDQLSERGFISARGRAGTFVTDFPPHRWRIGLVIPAIFGKRTSRFYNTIIEQAQRLPADGPIQITIYKGMACHPGSETMERLVNDVEEDQLAGLVLLDIPWESFEGTAVLDHPRLARLGMFSDVYYQGIPHVNNAPYHQEALDWFQAQHCKRLAVIHSSVSGTALPPAHIQNFISGASRLGMSVEDEWVVPIHLETPQTARMAATLLMKLPAKERPDGIWIDDDHLVEEATLGVMKSGKQCPADVKILAHRNFPDCPVAHVPVHWVGRDICQALTTGMSLMGKLLEGQHVPMLTMIPPMFEEEGSLESARSTQLNPQGV